MASIDVTRSCDYSGSAKMPRDGNRYQSPIPVPIGRHGLCLDRSSVSKVEGWTLPRIKWLFHYSRHDITEFGIVFQVGTFRCLIAPALTPMTMPLCQSSSFDLTTSTNFFEIRIKNLLQNIEAINGCLVIDVLLFSPPHQFLRITPSLDPYSK